MQSAAAAATAITARPTIPEDMVKETFAAMRRKEARTPRPSFPPRSPYMECHQILVSYMISLCEELGLSNTTTFRACALMARLFTCPRVNAESQKGSFQLVVLVCVSIAAKFEETPLSQPTMGELLDSADGQYTVEMFKQVELFALDFLRWEVNDITAACFSNLFLHRAHHGSALLDQEVKKVVILLLGLTLQDAAFLQYLPSVLCASALRTARIIVKQQCGPTAAFEDWDEAMVELTQYQPADLKGCCDHLRQKFNAFTSSAPSQEVMNANVPFSA